MSDMPADLGEAMALATAGEGAGGGALAGNILAFGRLLRRTGVPVGPSETMAAMEALRFVEIGDRRQVHAALRGVMVHRRDQFEIFDQAFLLFWRDPEAGRNAAAMAMLDGFKEREKAPPTSRRLAEALNQPKQSPTPPQPPEEKPPVEVALTVSERERL
ncbi:MAG: hypothetical protein EON47_10805 [Acetobacteraceae bacterium]|nr:MAG: hypothetical protein EON47_10805 [Acetobacteraceae bacterium]